MRYGVIGFVPGYMGQTSATASVDFDFAVDMPNAIVYGIKWHNGSPAFIVDNAELLFRYILGWVPPNHPTGTPLVLYAQKSENKFSILFTVSIESIIEKFRKDGPPLNPEDQVLVVNKYIHYEGDLNIRAKDFFGRDTTSVCFLDVKNIQNTAVPIQMYKLDDVRVSYDTNSFPNGSIIMEIKTPQLEMM